MCKNALPLLCSCLPFGLHGRCEHEQACLHFLRPGPEANLNVPGVAACNHRPSKYPQQAAAGMAASAIILQCGPATCGVSDAQAVAAGHINPHSDHGERRLAQQQHKDTQELEADVIDSQVVSLVTSEELKVRRDFKITQQLVKRYGETDGCPGCKCAMMRGGPRREHTVACRTKMEKSMVSDPEQAEKLITRDRRHGLVPDADAEVEEVRDSAGNICQ